MKSEAIREVTDWSKVDYHVPNHTYLLENGRMTAYIPSGKQKPTFFNTPKQFDKRGRNFVKADKKLFGV